MSSDHQDGPDDALTGNGADTGDSRSEPRRSSSPQTGSPTSGSPPPGSTQRGATPRRKPTPEVPSTVQLGLSPALMMTRGLFGRCPVCGSRHLFRHWVTMVERCPECSFLFERLEGHWIGAIAVNTVAVIGLMLMLIVGTLIITYPELIPLQLIPVLIVIGALGPIVFYPASKTLWTSIDLLMRPLKWGEVDPRYVVVDPLRDPPSAPPETPH